MSALKTASRFAVLSLEDSDEELGGASSASKKPNNKVSHSKYVGPYVVDASNQGAKKKKRKGKPKTPAANFDENDDGEEENELKKVILLSRQEFVDEEEKRRHLARDHEKVLAETLHNSLESFEQPKRQVKANTTFRDEKKVPPGFDNPSSTKAEINGPSCNVHEDQHERDNASSLMSDIDSEAERIRKLRPKLATSDTGNPIVVLYRNKCLEFKTILQAKDEEIVKFKADLDKLKAKNKMYFQLFKDAETKEKAEILHEINKVKSVNSELTEQISLIDVELQQVKSRNHELEIELKKQMSKATKQ